MIASTFKPRETSGEKGSGTGKKQALEPVGEKNACLDLPDADYVVFDTELTGLNAKKDSIVSIGAVRMQGKRIFLGDTFYRLVDPGTPLTACSVVIHEITPSEAAAAPGMDALLPEFVDFCGDAIVVGHVLSIDLAFLNREMKLRYGKVLRNRAVDTARLYQWIRQKEENACAFHEGLPESFDLFSLAKKYQIPALQAHNALCDAFLTAQVLQRLLCELPGWGITTLNDLLKIGRP